MAAEQALALVVRGTDWSETSRITTLFTREFGKVRALAKGGRRLKSSFDVSFDLLTVCRVVFLRKAHGGLDLLTEARMEERFPALRENLPALYAGYYVAELLADGTQDYDPHPDLFDAALATLRALGGEGAPTLPGFSNTTAVSREATQPGHPLSASERGPGGEVEGRHASSPFGEKPRAEAPNRSPEPPHPPGPPLRSGEGGDERPSLPGDPATPPSPIHPAEKIVVGQRVQEEKKRRARELRHDMTPAERLLWEHVRDNALGHRFRRQQVIDGFIADFYCHAASLVVELDGSAHDDSADYDADRDRVFTARGLLVVRVRNDELSENTPAVLARVTQLCQERTRSPEAGGEVSTADLISRFELVWLKELGYTPRLDVCTGCGRAVPAGVPRVWFAASAGGVVCTPCSPAAADRRPLTGDALRALAALSDGRPADLGPVRAELRAVLGQVVSYVLGRRPRMHRFITAD